MVVNLDSYSIGHSNWNFLFLGSLKPGESNWNHFWYAVSLSQAPRLKNFLYSEGKALDAIKSTTFGALYDLPSFGYPAMTEGTGVVRGYLLSFADDSWMPSIDELEEYDPRRSIEENVYNRVKIDVYSDDGSYLGKHWGYSMQMSRIRSFGGVLIESGEWSPKSRK